MDKINKAAALGVVFFSVMLAGFVGMKVDQTTVAILAGAFIGLVVAIPTTVLILVAGLRQPNEGQVKAPPQSVPHSMSWTTHETHNHLHVVHVPREASPFDIRMSVARQLGVTPNEAKRMINAGEVKCLPAKGE